LPSYCGVLDPEIESDFQKIGFHIDRHSRLDRVVVRAGTCAGNRHGIHPELH
jgi:hypothetical protein